MIKILIIILNSKLNYLQMLISHKHLTISTIRVTSKCEWKKSKFLMRTGGQILYTSLRSLCKLNIF